MFSSDDTIVAIATPSGRGGIGVVRVSGASAREVAKQVLTRERALVPRRATLTTIRCEPTNPSSVSDQVVATWFPAPRSYTGEDVVEISAHGSPVVLRGIVRRLVAAGARMARPGEFTFRAFLNGRLDLVQAEAVADLVEAATPLQARTAFDQLHGTLTDCLQRLDGEILDLVASLEASLDFPEEGFHFIGPDEAGTRINALMERLDRLLSQAARGRVIREGATVVIVGRPNVGKSSLFNALVGRDRAIVTDVPGTTRDLVTERMELDGLAVTLVDTAGLRESGETVEREGIERARRALETSDLLLLVIDSGENLTHEDRCLLEEVAPAKRIVVNSKGDRPPKGIVEEAILVSTLMEEGIDNLRHAMVETLTGEEPLSDSAALSNLRHILLLQETRAALSRARASIRENAPEEFVLLGLHEARASLGEVVGATTSEQVLQHIFSRFCIGK